MAKLKLWFNSYKSCVLDRTMFFHPLLQSEQWAVRGKTAGAFSGYTTFQWTPAVQAMTTLVIRSLARSLSQGTSHAILEGAASSPASSLDYALSKAPNWVLDVFGVDKSGLPIARRLFRRTNPERKKGGVVSITINDKMLEACDISVFLNELPLQNISELEKLADTIEKNWLPHRNNTHTGESTLEREAPVQIDSNFRGQSYRNGAEHNSNIVNFAQSIQISQCCPCCGKKLPILQQVSVPEKQAVNF